jgi:hypothetical protein
MFVTTLVSSTYFLFFTRRYSFLSGYKLDAKSESDPLRGSSGTPDYKHPDFLALSRGQDYKSSLYGEESYHDRYQSYTGKY